MLNGNGLLNKAGVNGHLNGAALPERAEESKYNRSSLLMLNREIERGQKLSDEEAENQLRKIIAIRDDPQASKREVLRACECIEAMRTRSINVAMYLDKMERAEDGTATDVVEHREFRVSFDRRG